MVLPLLKLGTLALKTLSKPVASRLKQQAALHPRFRQLIINMAQANHQITTKMQRRIYGHATGVEIRPLNEEKAVQNSVDLIGELCLHFIDPRRQKLVDANVLFIRRIQTNFETLVKSRLYWHVAGVLLIFEVQRSARSEARKEELRKQELEAVRQTNDGLAAEVELLKQRLQELEQMARGRGLTGILNFKQSKTENGKTEKTA